jgi:hypothetical protein
MGKNTIRCGENSLKIKKPRLNRKMDLMNSITKVESCLLEKYKGVLNRI